MPDEVSRLLGLAGLRVTGVLEGEGDALDLEVESVARAERCPHCGGEDLVIKERPVVGVRDLALVGRVARILWRKRRFGCRGCGWSPSVIRSARWPSGWPTASARSRT